MISRILLISFFSGVCAMMVACEKYNRLGELNEVVDTCQIRGRLILYDILTQQAVSIPQTKKKVLLFPSYATDEINYLYSATSDDDGYFAFKNLTKGKNYRLIYEEMINGKLSRADTVISAPNTALQLLLEPSFDRQTGIYVTVLDPNGEVVPKAQVCFFSNQLAFLSNNCVNSDHSMLTDAGGRAYTFGIKPNTYYILVTTAIGGVNYIAKQTVEVKNRVEQLTLHLSAPSESTGSLQYTVLDADGFPVNDSRVCMYFNPTLYNNGNCQNSNYSDSTNANGIVDFIGLEPRTYYTRAEFQIGNVIYKADLTSQVQAGATKKDTLHLR